MKKGLALLALAVMLFAACGREGTGDESVLTLADSPTPKASAAPEKTKEPEATATVVPKATTAAAATTAPEATSAPVEDAPEGQLNRPKDGTYTYAFEGKASDPFNPAAPPQEFEGEAEDEISHSGDDYTHESTNSEEAGRSTTRSRYTSSDLKFLSFKIESQGGTFSCTFDPPLVIAKFPVKPETYPTQQFKGDGNACDGKIDITVVKKESVKDATGKSWETWQTKVRIEIHIDSDFGPVDVIQNETRWVSPDLGTEIKTTSTGEQKVGQSKSTSSSSSILKDYP